MSKTRFIPGWAGSILSRALLIYGPRLAQLVPGKPLNQVVEAAVPATANLISAVSDNDPNNAEQAKVIALEFVRNHAVPLAVETVNARVAAITDDRLRNGLAILATPVGRTLVALTDEDPDNATQLETVVDDFITNEGAQEFILNDLTLPVLEKVIKEPILRAFIIETISTGLKEGAEELAEIEIFNRKQVIENFDAKVAELNAA